MLIIPIEVVRHLLGLPDTLEIYEVGLVDNHLEVTCQGVVATPHGGQSPVHFQRGYIYTLRADGTWEILPMDPEE